MHVCLIKNNKHRYPILPLKLTFSFLFTTCEVGMSVEGLSGPFDECVLCSLSLSLMLKWLGKESEVLCEAVIRLNYKGFRASLLPSPCSVPFSLLFDDMK